MRNFKHFTKYTRYKLEALYNSGIPVKEISKTLLFSVSSVYREIKLGLYDHLNSDYTSSLKYSADLAQRNANFRRCSGRDLKLGNDYDFVNFVEHMISKKHYSPEAVLLHIKTHNLKFKTNVCTTTLYSYIDKGLFLNISNKNLLRKNKKRKCKKVHSCKSAAVGDSIELRPKYISMREDFGHWEMDSVVGKKNKGSSLLVLTERKTRYELIFKTAAKTSDETVRIFDMLQMQFGKNFKMIFKTITVDNGSEFKNVTRLSHDRFGRERTKIFYCHPYTSCERGSNEVQNQFIRRFIPKGSVINSFSKKSLLFIQDYINNYPRGIFGGLTSEILYNNELSYLGIFHES